MRAYLYSLASASARKKRHKPFVRNIPNPVAYHIIPHHATPHHARFPPSHRPPGTGTPLRREQALTSVNHPGGPAGLAAAIAAHAFPSEEGGAPAPRAAQSPARRASTTSLSTPPRSEGRRRSSSSGGKGVLDGNGVAGASPVRPRFITPGRSRRSAFAAKGRSSSFGGGSTLRFASPDRSRANSVVARPHRLPLSDAALEAASHAVGLSTALGYAPPALDPHRGMTVRAVYRAAELLYSRHALGLRWSKGALVVAQAAAAANAAGMATASVAAAAAVAAKRKNRIKSKRGGARSSSGGGGGKNGGGRASKGAENAWQWGSITAAADAEAGGSSDAGKTAKYRDSGGRDGGGGASGDSGVRLSPRLSPRLIGQNGELEDMHQMGDLADGTTAAAKEAPQPGEDSDEKGSKKKSATAAAVSTKSKVEIRTVVSPRGTHPSVPKPLVPRKVPPSPGPAPMGRGHSKKKAPTGRGKPLENGGAGEGRGERRDHGKGDGGEATDDGATADAAVAWTWGGGGGGGKGGGNGASKGKDSKGKDSKAKDTSKTPLPSDVRQLSR